MNNSIMKYRNRFFELAQKPVDVNLPLPIGTIINDASRLRIITSWGMYDNQYWTEMFDKNGVLWSGGAHYVAVDADVCKSTETINICLASYIASFEAYYQKWFTEYVDRSLFEAHVNVFKEILV